MSFSLNVSILDALRTIRDPEKPHTLEDLNVVYEDGIFVQNPTKSNVYVVSRAGKIKFHDILLI